MQVVKSGVAWVSSYGISQMERLVAKRWKRKKFYKAVAEFGT